MEPTGNRTIQRRWSAAAVMAAVTAWLAGAAGCGPFARVEMYQPREDGSQHLMQLESYDAKFASDQGATDRYLLAWPLPGARTGRPYFTLYLHVPPGGGTSGVGQDANDSDTSGEARGFLIQEAGRLAGLTRVVRGRITVTGGKNRRNGDLYVKCADGTEIKGRFRADRADLTVEFFEDDHAGDIAALHPTTQPDSTRPTLADDGDQQ